MSLRELRASWQRLVLFFLCIALGVGGIVLLRSVVQDVRAGLSRDAKTLIAADVIISTSRPWDDATRRMVEDRIAAARVTARVESIETNTMVRPADERPVARMAEVRGVGPGFPLYGTVDLEGGARFSYALLANHGALVRPELLVQLDAKVGEQILIGKDRFTIRGVILSEPGRRLGAFSLGPRVLVSAADLEQSGLTGWGSRVTRQILLKLPDARAQRLTTELQQDLRGRFVSARSYQSTEDHVGEDLARAENYLSLVGLVIVILGGIGVSSVTRVFVRQKVRSIAILKCLGATSRQVFVAYLAQAVLLGLAGCLLGVGLAAAAVAALPLVFDVSALASLPHGLTVSAVAQGVAVGLLVALLFSVVPLLDVRRVKPSLLLREGGGRGAARDWLRWAAIGGLLVALVLIASWQAASLKVGLAVSVGLACVALALHLAGLGLVRAVRPLASARSVALRHAVLRLTRPGNQTRAVLLAVGLGAFFIVGVRSLQSNLLREFSFAIDTNGADMFLIDVQPSQAASMRAFLDERGAKGAALIPVMRARVTAVHGRDINLDGYENVRRRGELGREFTVTWREHLTPNEKVVRGRFWDGEGLGGPPRPNGRSNAAGEVSVEGNLADRYRIGIGDVIRFDILGREVSATVTSIRSVDFRDARQGGFIFVFRPGLLDRAPATMIAPVRGPASPASRARLQRDIVDRFPNVSIIDLREVLDVVERVLSKVTLGVSVVGGLVLFTGVLILVGSVSMTRFERIYEAAIFRTLGAGTRLLTTMTAFEYTVLGLLSGLIGSLAAIVLSWYVSTRILTINWSPGPVLIAAGIGLTALLVTSVGLLASADILRRRPLGDLRSE
jgi:putative ABC transport system permease protein